MHLLALAARLDKHHGIVMDWTRCGFAHSHLK
jgi:hypothetical protein